MEAVARILNTEIVVINESVERLIFSLVVIGGCFMVIVTKAADPTAAFGVISTVVGYNFGKVSTRSPAARTRARD